MNRRRKCAMVLMASILGLVALLLAWNREPRYQGKTISAWVDIGLKATDSVPWDEPNVALASNAIHQIGAPAFDHRFSMATYQSGLRMRAAKLAEKLGPTGRGVSRWLLASADKDLTVHIDRSAFIDYSLASETNVFLPRLLAADEVFLENIAAALYEDHAPSLAEIFLTQTNKAGRHARMVLLFMGRKAASADPILRSFIETNRSHQNWESVVTIIARAGLHPESTVKLICADTGLADGKKLELLSWASEPGIPATAKFLAAADPAVRRQALLQLLLHTERRLRLNQAMKPTFRLSQSSGRPSPLPLSNGWRPPSETIRVLQHAGSEIQLASIGIATDLMGLNDGLLEKAAFRFDDTMDARYRRQAIYRFVEVLTTDADPQVAQAAASALAGLHLPHGR